MALLTRRCSAALVRAIALLGDAVLCAHVLRAQGGLPQRAEEYRLKAAFIYNLAKFVEWPTDAFADATTPLTVCVLGADPFGPALDETLRGHFVAGRSLATRRLMAVEPGCHVMFVSASETKRLPVVIDQLRGQSVLLVGDDGSFLEHGGMVLLATQGERMRLFIRPQAAEHARLKFSARVLALAGPSRASGGTP